MPRTWRADREQDVREFEALPTPEGWVWSPRPTVHDRQWVSGTIAYDGPMSEPGAWDFKPFFQALQRLWEWLQENRITALSAYDGMLYDRDEGRHMYVFTSFRCVPGTRTPTNVDLKPPTIDGVTASWVDENGEVIQCLSCQSPFGSRRHSLTRLDGDIVCTSHRRQCRYVAESTGSRCNTFTNRRYLFCATHDQRISCRGCGDEHSVLNSNGLVRSGLSTSSDLCGTCQEYSCEDCPTVGQSEVSYRERYRAMLCQPCADRWATRPDPNVEQYDDAIDNILPPELAVENHPKRPVRYCSIEMEIAEGGDSVLSNLEREGLAHQGGRVMGYHSGNRNDAFCYMETDSSLGSGGGELIIPFLKLNDEETLERLHRTIRAVRGSVKNGPAVMDVRCGLHIHVDAHRMGIHHVRNLAVLFNFLEDPLYRMSAARYMRHRGQHYAQKIDKSGLDNVRAFGVNFLNANGHSHALNVGHYWNAMRTACRCGAVLIGQHQDCECNLGKCTFEFRIYNGTTNFRKIHAYSALSQSLVGYARGADDDLSLNDYPVLEYVSTADIDNDLKQKWDNRIEWMFRNLYFSDYERQSLLYVLKNCQLNELGEDRLIELSELPYSGNTLEHDAPPNADRELYPGGIVFNPPLSICPECGYANDDCRCDWDGEDF